MRGRLGPGPEFDLIRKFLGSAPASEAPGVQVGPGDDCAIVTGGSIALSSDMSVEGVHFRRDWLSPEEIGWRAASAALSDLAAMAARPLGLLASLALPRSDAGDFGVRVMAGVRDACTGVGGTLLGGDLTSSPGPLVIDITVVGEASATVLRSGAGVGDELWVTGQLGGSAVAVREWLGGSEPPPAARARYAHPRPRVREALWLRDHVELTSLIDLSDGLAGDLAHISAASGIALVLDAAAVPIDRCVTEAVADAGLALDLATSGGEDYEICFTAPAGRVAAVADAFSREMGVAVTRIGTVESGAGVHWLGAGGAREPLAGGYQHFDGAS